VVVSSLGTGHPSYRPGQTPTQIITDAYPKELSYLQSHTFKFKKDNQDDNAVYVPILLTTVSNDSIKVIAELPVTLKQPSTSSSFWSSTSRELGVAHDMRCDPHPAWSPLGDKLALNLLNITTGKRMVALMNMEYK